MIPNDPLTPGGRIVVGVDDSEHAAHALRWALREAVLRQATVEAVHAWQLPMTALPFGASVGIPADEAALDEAARAGLDEVVEAALAAVGEPVPEVQRTAVPGAAAYTLIDISSDADLLVVGSHGHTGLRHLVLGSVAQTCVQHAACPVTVLRLTEDDADPET